ncbi:MAG: response regulator [Myxococcaceae bacterium]
MSNRGPPTDKQRLLVVDDQPFFREFLREKLEELGYLVATCGDAAGALRTVEASETPLVVLLDLMMPEVSGLELLRALTAQRCASRMRVVLMSAHHSVEGAALYHPLVVGRAQKPVDVDDLHRLATEAAQQLRA